MAWKWLTFSRLPKVITPSKRALYKQIVAEFAEVVKEIGTRKGAEVARLNSSAH